jgi:outer membrane protein, heavy metal efflux system
VKSLTLYMLLGAFQPALPEAPPGLPAVELPALVAEARARNPEIAAARRVADAAGARIPAAGALPDPVLSAGLMNAPTDFRLADDEMAMATLQLTQMLPAPGTRSAREAIAREAYSFTEQRAAETEIAVVARLKTAYYELYFVERALDVLERNRGLLEDFAEIARGRFAVGATPQQDVLRAQTEVTRLDEQLAGLRARRTAAVGEINAILDRPAATDLTTVYPEALRTIVFAAPPPGAFTAAALEPALTAGFPTAAELESMALGQRPALRAQDHRVQQYRESLRLAERARFPDIEVMLGYGRQGSGGMQRLSAMVAVPLPVFAPRKQRQAVIESQHALAAAEHERAALMSEVRAEIIVRLAEVVRIREQVLLLADGVIPQAQATITSAAAAYQTGTVEFLSLLDAQAMLFRNEIELGRQLADFGRAFAQLELAVGRELVETGES